MATAASPLLSVPRKTTAEVDFGPALRQIISTTYSEPADRYTEEIASLNRTRQDAVRGSAGSDTTARDLLYRYFGQLELLELRFPEIRVPFPWNDAFTPSKSISQLSLAYEKASVIFNIAATLSALAANQNRSSPEGLKRSFNFYRAAAGMFTYINDNFLHAPSTDLGRDLVKILITLMTAQATEVFLERMNEEKRSPGLKSKICAQVAAVYAGIVEEVRDHVGKAIFDRSWLVLVQTKAKYFSSLALYNRSLADSAGNKHGEALARLALAESQAKEAHRISLGYSTSYYGSSSSTSQTLPLDAGTMLQELCNNHVKAVTEARAAALKDNDLIYHALVPSEASLAPIEKSASVAEPIPIQEIYASPDVQKLVGQDIFIKLVPLSVIESSSLYSEEKAKILRTEGERCEIADVEITNGLEHLGLPGSLAKFKSGAENDVSIMADPGSQVAAWSTEVRSSESEKRVEASIAELVQLRERATADIEWVTSQLDNEQRECEQARVKFDHHFEQSPSGSHTRSWRTDVKNDRDALVQARASDDQVLNLWASVRDDVNVLASGQEALEAVFADAVMRADQQGGSGAGGSGRNLLDLDLPDDEGDAINRSIETIQEAINKLHKLRKERADVLADLKERIHNDDISQLLILNRKSQNIEPTLFAAELEKFRPHQARLQATVQAQQNTMALLNKEYEKLTGGKRGREIHSRFAKADRAKKDTTARFKRAYEAYREIRAGVTKGIDFYRELSSLLASVRSEVAQFVSSRAQERSSMIASAEMRQRMSGSASRRSTDYSASDLDRAFDSMGLSSSAGQRGGAPRPPSSAAPAQSSFYSTSSPPPPQSAAAYGGRASMTPSLPPKPPGGPTPSSSAYRQNSTGLPPPPPPSQQQQLHHPTSSYYAASALPPPPTGPSYSSPPPPPAPAQNSYSSYSSPPPPSQMQHSPAPPSQQYDTRYASPYQAPQPTPSVYSPPPSQPTGYHPQPQSSSGYLPPPPPSSSQYQSSSPGYQQQSQPSYYSTGAPQQQQQQQSQHYGAPPGSGYHSTAPQQPSYSAYRNDSSSSGNYYASSQGPSAPPPAPAGGGQRMPPPPPSHPAQGSYHPPPPPQHPYQQSYR